MMDPRGQKADCPPRRKCCSQTMPQGIKFHISILKQLIGETAVFSQAGHRNAPARPSTEGMDRPNAVALQKTTGLAVGDLDGSNADETQVEQTTLQFPYVSRFTRILRQENHDGTKAKIANKAHNHFAQNVRGQEQEHFSGRVPDWFERLSDALKRVGRSPHIAGGRGPHR